MSEEKIFVSKPSLPPLEDFIPYLEEIWETHQLTNNGVFSQKLEKSLAKFLRVPGVVLFNNGTTALISALRSLDIKGEVITTPYTFVATSHAILWNNLIPVFVDIEENSFNIDAKKIEAAITDNTAAIMPVHCYGHACNIEELNKISKKYNIPIIYDAAHAFGVEDEVGSILRHGDLSVLSFHATKVFNTFEGGAVICHDEEKINELISIRNFGFDRENESVLIGLNGKMSEVNAAFGLIQLEYYECFNKKRKLLYYRYKERLQNINGIDFIEENCRNHNYSYLPIIVNKNYTLSRDELCSVLEINGVYARKYFHPLVSAQKAYKKNANKYSLTPVAEKRSRDVLCLPLYPDLSIDAVNNICDLIIKGAM